MNDTIHNTDDLQTRSRKTPQHNDAHLHSTTEEFSKEEHKRRDSGVRGFAKHGAEQAETLVRNVISSGWQVVHYHALPGWMHANEYLVEGHRPEMNSAWQCFASIFRLHTETINIWTHLIGFFTFILLTIHSILSPTTEGWQDKTVYFIFFLGALLCLGFSSLFHTLHCHSERINAIFHKLDYCGITLLTLGSCIAYIYYAFYQHFYLKVFYMGLLSVLSAICIVVSLAPKFATSKFRPLRAAIFIALGLCGVFPATHYIILEGFERALYEASLGWLVLMATLYITGAVIYALRVPERYYPGRFDIWFQSHQIFHVFVVAAALVHFHGLNQIAQLANKQ